MKQPNKSDLLYCIGLFHVKSAWLVYRYEIRVRIYQTLNQEPKDVLVCTNSEDKNPSPEIIATNHTFYLHIHLSHVQTIPTHSHGVIDSYITFISAHVHEIVHGIMVTLLHCSIMATTDLTINTVTKIWGGGGGGGGVEGET